MQARKLFYPRKNCFIMYGEYNTERGGLMKRTKFNVLPQPEPRPFRRPKKYETPAALQAAVDSYFDSCYESSWQKVGVSEDGEPILQEKRVMVKPPTICGLAIHLGMTRLALLCYQYDYGDEYGEVVDFAKARVEAFCEESLFMGKASPSGVIFSLTNNFKGWSNTSRQEVSGPDGQPLNMNVTTNDERARETRARLLAELDT